MFEQASKIKLRFSTAKGMLSVEDLWAMDLKELDTLTLELQALTSAHTSFLPSEQKVSTQDGMRFDIAKHIIECRLDDAAEANARVVREQKRSRIMAILRQKEDTALADSTVEELEQLLADMR